MCTKQSLIPLPSSTVHVLIDQKDTTFHTNNHKNPSSSFNPFTAIPVTELPPRNAHMLMSKYSCKRTRLNISPDYFQMITDVDEAKVQFFPQSSGIPFLITIY